MHKKIKIFCIIGQLGTGGTEKQLFLFLKHLDKNRVAPIVVVSSKSDTQYWRETIENLGIQVLTLTKSSKLMKLLEFRRLLKEHSPKSIISWSFFTNAFCIACGKTKFIGSLRGDLDAMRQQMSHLHWKLCILPKRFIVNCQHLKLQLENELNQLQVNINVIYNIFEEKPLPEEKRATLKLGIREEFNIDKNVTLIAGVGKNIPEKDFKLFLDTFAIASEKSNIHALLIGRCGIELQNEIAELQLTEKITVTGEIPDASRVLHAADIYFLSSKSEGMPNALIEAVNAGCAPLATDVGGIKDILGTPSENRFFSNTILDTRDANNASIKILNLIEDKKLREMVVKTNFARIELFRPQKIMEQFYSVLALDLQDNEY